MYGLSKIRKIITDTCRIVTSHIYVVLTSTASKLEHEYGTIPRPSGSREVDGPSQPHKSYIGIRPVFIRARTIKDVKRRNEKKEVDIASDDERLYCRGSQEAVRHADRFYVGDLLHGEINGDKYTGFWEGTNQ